jgi:hypothetical protein
MSSKQLVRKGRQTIYVSYSPIPKNVITEDALVVLDTNFLNLLDMFAKQHNINHYEYKIDVYVDSTRIIHTGYGKLISKGKLNFTYQYETEILRRSNNIHNKHFLYQTKEIKRTLFDPSKPKIIDTEKREYIFDKNVNNFKTRIDVVNIHNKYSFLNNHISHISEITTRDSSIYEIVVEYIIKDNWSEDIEIYRDLSLNTLRN